MKDKDYMVYFDFTTVHGSRFVGRSGELSVTSNLDPVKLEKSQQLYNLIVEFIYTKKPNYNIVFVDIKNITKSQP